MKITETSRVRLKRLLRAFQGAKKILVVTHDYPDPDAMGSAMALHHLLERRLKCKVEIGYGGIIGRAENRALVKAVRAPLTPIDGIDVASFDAFALIDTQPHTGNNSLPPGVKVRAVIDHHPLRPATRRVPFYDVRTRYGATATMMLEYLRASRYRVDPDLATALFYGIRAETQNLSREALSRDRDAYVALFSHVDFRKIFDIEYAGVSREYFGLMGSALANTKIYGDVVITSLGKIANPDFCAEFCDMVLRLEGTRWALCMGHSRGILYVSMRTRERTGHAGRTIARVVRREGKAGGHGMMAGGLAHIDRFEPPTYRKAVRVITQRFLEATGAAEQTCEELLGRPSSKAANAGSERKDRAGAKKPPAGADAAAAERPRE